MAWDFELLCRQKPEVKEAMEALGNCSPIIRGAQVKGYVRGEDGGSEKVYYSSNDLVRLSHGLLEMAKWLDRREMSGE